ncbi:MAG TPA: DUF488 domain-containing protein [Vicinamibacterales bacterium]
MTILTIGHSTRTASQFLELLLAHGVDRLADVRTVPSSRRHPHFSRDALATLLAGSGIHYTHFPGLGGLRTPRPDSINTAWREPGFRGYADHMATRAFEESLEALIAYADSHSVAVMCAEAKWWQCHRQLIADALVARGVFVAHIMSSTEAPGHDLTRFARVSDEKVQYPALI